MIEWCESHLFQVTYIFAAMISLAVGFFVGVRLLKREDHSQISLLIRVFTGMGIGLSTFGLLFLLIHATIKPFEAEDKRWEQSEISVSSSIQEPYDLNIRDLVKENEEISLQNPKSTEQTLAATKSNVRYKKNDDFDSKTGEFNEKTLSTANIIFSIAGISLGTLGILWLGHLESTRLRKDREHDQKVQEDRLLSLLSLGIDLFLYIDNKELDFVYKDHDKKYCHQKYNSIQWDGANYFFLTKEIVEGDEHLSVEREKHLASLYHFLYKQKNLHQGSILNDVHKIIDELKIVFYEKDIILYDVDIINKDSNLPTSKKLRKLFITLLKQFNDYNNFLSGNTVQSDFTMDDYEVYERKLPLVEAEKEDLKIFLRKKLDVCDEEEKIFYDEFLLCISKEFAETYLVKESAIFSLFKTNEIKDIFFMMTLSNLDASKFFNSYFKESFKRFITCKKEYSNIDLSQQDLLFEDYLEVFNNTFLQIDADIKSVKELYSLFYSFVKLYETISMNGKNNG